uniref:Lysosomal enzyme trafficking factor n=1 Tax=Scophthalmus maximus TaxID=52904 RepID=A0A8D3DYL5_SCOMX
MTQSVQSPCFSGPVWRMMNFRQRMGWVCVALYLLLSIMAVYYIFEVHTLSLERVQRGGISLSAPPPAVSWSHLLSLPVWMWASVFLLPYLQLFLFLFSCTRADPRAVGYCVLPVCIALLCSRRHATDTGSITSDQQVIDK